MHAVEAKSRDGLTLVSYLTLPAEVEGDRPPKPLPMVLIVHGGPWARDIFGYRSDHQWLADRGYAVLTVNYRGSAGFGKAFIAASEKEHARKLHDDLIDMVEWAMSAKVFLGWRTKILRAADAFRTRRREGTTSFYTKTTTDLRIGRGERCSRRNV